MNPQLGTLVRLAQSLSVDLRELLSMEGSSSQAGDDRSVPYLTFSEWFWASFKRASSVLGEDWENPPEQMRRQFELFLKLVRPEGDLTSAQIESIWEDRGFYLPERQKNLDQLHRRRGQTSTKESETRPEQGKLDEGPTD
jgi:hypothetical protein